MGYQEYGISRALVERVKQKTRQPQARERLKETLGDLSKSDLQNPAKIRELLRTVSRELDEPVTALEAERIVKFVLDQKIDPRNTFHLIRLWGMFH
jgi:hypothetical protein